MGKPAARIGDMTCHGGALVVGCPTVLIGGVPAARVGDMHVCPMLNPGTPPPPHVGGPVVMGSPMVLIGGMPAARMGDMATCAGPPDTIVLGCPTVLIGEGGSGAAAGGGGGAPAVASAVASAATAQIDNLEASTKIEHWVEFQFVDSAGLPVSGIPYKFTDPDGNESAGVLKPDGRVRRDALNAGQCKVQLYSVSNAKWSRDKADVGDKLKMSAEIEGYDDGTPAVIQVYRRDIKGPDVPVETIETSVEQAKVEGEWEYVYPEETESEKTGKTAERGYTSPDYFFEVLVGKGKARSGFLPLNDELEIELRDENDNPIANEDYILCMPNGEIRKGKLDGKGYKKEKDLPPGQCIVRFPNLKNTELGS